MFSLTRCQTPCERFLTCSHGGYHGKALTPSLMREEASSHSVQNFDSRTAGLERGRGGQGIGLLVPFSSHPQAKTGFSQGHKSKKTPSLSEPPHPGRTKKKPPSRKAMPHHSTARREVVFFCDFSETRCTRIEICEIKPLGSMVVMVMRMVK